MTTQEREEILAKLDAVINELLTLAKILHEVAGKIDDTRREQ